MELGHFRTQAVALIAAYAMAVQALLLASLPVGPALSAASFAPLCSHGGTDGSGPPIQRDLPCAAICAALGHGIAGPLPPAIVVAVAAPHAVLALIPVDNWVPPHVAVRSPHAPRAPPLA